MQEEETTRTMGYHAGFGAERRVHRHVGLCGDYRHSKIRFGDDGPEPSAMETADQRPSGPSALPSWMPFPSAEDGARSYF